MAHGVRRGMGFLCLALVFTVYKRCGAVEESRCVEFAGPEGRAVNRCDGRLGVIWHNTIKLGQVVIITVCFHYVLSCY